MRDMTRMLAIQTASLLATAGTSLAADGFSPPDGCTAFLTTQMKDCQVSLMWRCDIAPKGDIWDALFDANGLQSIVNYDREFQWVEGTYMWDGSREELISPSEDPISLDELLDKGVDTFSFLIKRTNNAGSQQVRVIGADQLTGEIVAIDGVSLMETQTEFQMLKEDGSLDYHARGQQFVSSDMRVFFTGKDEVVEGDTVTAYDSTPLEFIFPGEPGFGETRPLYGCNSKKSSLTDDRMDGQTNAG